MALEVRSRELPFILGHSQTIGRLIYEKMTKAPEHVCGADLKSHYQAQGGKLSKQIRAG